MALTVLDAPHCWHRKCMRRVALSLSSSVSTLLQPGHSTYLSGGAAARRKGEEWISGRDRFRVKTQGTISGLHAVG
eukprot:scaffold13007_cov21-Tisochrysis_lutea.AAC.1